MKEITLKVKGTISPKNAGSLVTLVFDSRVSFKNQRAPMNQVGILIKSGKFGKDITLRLPDHLTPEEISKLLQCQLIVLKAEKLTYKSKHTERIKLSVPETTLDIRIGPQPEPKQLHISGKLTFYKSGDSTDGLTVKLLKKNTLISEGSCDMSGRYGFIVSEEEFDLPQVLSLKVEVSPGFSNIINNVPDQIKLTSWENKTQNIVLNKPTAKTYQITCNFFKENSNKPFIDKLAVRMSFKYNRREKEFRELIRSNGKVSRTITVTTLVDAVLTKVDLDVIDKLGNRYKLGTHIINKTLKPGGKPNTVNITGIGYPDSEDYSHLRKEIAYIRSYDLISLKFVLNYILVKGKNIITAFIDKPGTFSVEFPPQSFIEEAFFEVDQFWVKPPLQVLMEIPVENIHCVFITHGKMSIKVSCHRNS